MKTLKVARVDNFTVEGFDYFQMRNLMSDLPWHGISQVNWSQEFPYKPLVSFQIGHDNKTIYLHFNVEEEFIKAQYVRSNEAVWEDSCVEFFVSFDNKQTYFNLEFNVLGTGLIGFGNAIKSERNRLSSKQIELVKTASSVVNSGGLKTWAMILAIPVNVFEVANVASFAGLKAHANFYKCGDRLPNPHFISWSAISNPTPNFHLPNFFGEIYFE